MICMRPGFNPMDEDCQPGSGRYAAVDVRQLEGHLYVPTPATGIAVIADAFPQSGLRSITHSIEARLRRSHLGTCQIGLLDREELGRLWLQNDVPLLANRFAAVLHYLKKQEETAHLPIALVGNQQAAAAALMAATEYPEWVQAVVCVAGNPDAATAILARVATPTILVVPSKSESLLQSNQRAFWKLRCTSQLAVIRDAGPRFAELDALLACRNVIAQWCARYLKTADTDPTKKTFSCSGF